MGNRPSPLRKAIRWTEVDKVKKILDHAGGDAARLINEDHTPDCIMESCSRSIGNAFYYAVRWNRVEIVGILLDYGGDPYSTGAYGETCMHLAARNNYVDIGRILISCGFDVRVTDDNGRHPIHSASSSIFDTSGFVRFILEQAKDVDYVNVRDFYGRTPLHTAASVNNTEVAQTLLDRGAMVNVLDKNGNSPLHEARRRPAMWQLLVEHGADVDAKNNDDLTAEQMARSG